MNLRNYLLVTAAYWGFTVTDGALRMLVLLYFHDRGYDPIQLAFLFLLYELCGMATNLAGGFIAAKRGVYSTLAAGLSLQVIALGLLSLLDPSWTNTFSLAFVIGTQALSGIAKDLTKVSSKSAIKTLLPNQEPSTLFTWVALLTGSKNALKGTGFFLGGLLLSQLGFQHSLWAMSGALLLVLVMVFASLPRDLGQTKPKRGSPSILSRDSRVNWLSAARFFLFGSRDIWFVVGVPLFLLTRLEWKFIEVGSFLALWVIVYGVVQSLAPSLLQLAFGRGLLCSTDTRRLAFLLCAVTLGLPIALHLEISPTATVIVGLAAYGFVFALNSSVHSFLILQYADNSRVTLDVGFYYMANAAGRLVGTLLSGILYQFAGLSACLAGSAIFALAAGLLSHSDRGARGSRIHRHKNDL